MPAAWATSRKVVWSVSTPTLKPGGKQPAWIAVGQPEPAQLIEHRLRQRHPSLLVAFPDDTQELIGFIDRTDFEYRLANPQAAGVHHYEAAFVDRVPHPAKQATDL